MPKVSVFADDALQRHDALGLAECIRGGEISAAEVVEAAIARSQAMNGECNAIATEAFDSARREATTVSSAAFGGVPTFVKDTDDVRGLPTIMGSRGVPVHAAKFDSGFVRQMRGVGLINLGKSTMPEFGLTGTTEPLGTGPTRNPWNTDYSTGGSSGGACALVAAGAVPIAHANDGAGSIRIPASCCGLVGLKSTWGRLAAVDGSKIMPVNILHQGVVTRSVRDTAGFYAEVERMYGSAGLPPIGTVEGPGKKRLRIALLTASPDGPSHPDCVEAVRRAGTLCEEMGHTIEEIAPPAVGSFESDFFAYWAAMAFAIIRIERRKFGRRFNAEQLEPLTVALANEFRGNWTRIFGAVRRLRAFRKRYAELFTRHDILLSPTLGHPPPEIGYLSTTLDFETCLSRVKSFFPFTPLQNVAGAPAVSMPAVRNAANLPIGVQFAGAVGDDRSLLELAFEFEAAVGWEHLSA